MKAVHFTCETCGKKASRNPANFHQSRRHFCSKKCSGISRRTKIKYTCSYCSKEFMANPSANRKYCSKNCTDESNRIKDIRICKHCGETFELNHSKGISINQMFCSQQCAGKAKRNGVPIKCLNCGEIFQAKPSHQERRRFCSYRCYHLYRGPSSLEKEMENALSELGVTYEPQVMFGDFCVDFLLPKHNIVIECDGNYWHSSLCAKNRDKIKDKLLTSLGYQVCRFGEDSIKSNSLECIREVMKNASDPL